MTTHSAAGGGTQQAYPPHDPGPDYDDAVYVISIASELAGMHPQTLRAYERKGLVHPSRTEGNTRRYSRRDVDRLRFIQHLTQEQGLNLAGVELVLRMGEQLESQRRRTGDLEEAVRLLSQRLKDDVQAAHKSHKFEIVPAPGRQVEPHATYGRPTRRRPSGSTGSRAKPDAKRATPIPPPEPLSLS
ncbi:MAG: MerR family transcriptional regulator/heat shock protein HspR [Glaciecola sp.]|jgi:MerR family transcriptional regulator/heat shock protein HspR